VPLPRVTLLFTLSGPQIQSDLIHEFSLHRDVKASAYEYQGAPAIRVETSDGAGAVWEVRSTVGLFDDRATEIRGHA
jgi:hypothetical protein